MSLPHALLTALVERSGSGSELAARFDKSIGHFWHATHQQIYRELARLEAAGWVQSQPEASARGRKRVYRIVPAGREELRRWVAQEDRSPALRDAFMVRLRAEGAVGPAGLQPEIERRLALHRAQLALYQDFERRDLAAGVPQDREGALQALVLQAGIRYESFWIDLLTQARTALELPAREAGQPPASGQV
ncbi:MAG TPA: PadR family transcriptional regulator [Burkholderiaceae bacterium]|jgi:DNA-binding PadR family transcriptional regulator|nr:PadR family transcriptional regulator [Burkholderiaceae bacterium]